MSLDLGIGYQAVEALWSAGLGAALGVLYDALRTARRRGGTVLAFVLDAVFWLLTGTALFLIGFAIGVSDIFLKEPENRSWHL